MVQSNEPNPWYVPPEFGLYEFDDTSLTVRPGAPARRWFPHFNGRVGQPADEVQLGWRDHTGRQVVVGTMVASTSPLPVEPSARGSVAFMVLGGKQLWIPDRVHGRGAELRAQLALAETDAREWSRSQVVVDGTPYPSRLTTLVGATAGYTVTGDHLVTFAAVGIEADEIRPRATDSPSEAYAVDPTEPHTTDELEQDWLDFFRDFPRPQTLLE